MFESETIILWVAGFVALWWVIDWLSLRQEGLRMPIRRGPLRALRSVLPKLWRNKTFLLALVCLWLIGATVAAVSSYLLSVTPEFGHGLGAAGPRIAGPMSLTGTLPEVLEGELPQALPRLVPLPLGGVAAILLIVLLAAGLIRVIIAPPREVGEEAARSLKLPVLLLALHIAAYGLLLAVGEGGLHDLGRPDAPWYGSPVIAINVVLVAGLLLAPVYALLWRLMLEIARDGVWSFKSSIRSIGPSWAPALLLLLLTIDLSGYGLLRQPLLDRVLDGILMALPVLLVFAPWAVVDRQKGFVAALRRSWHLFRQRPVDLIAFGLRFALLFAVLGGIVALFEPAAAGQAGMWYQPLLGVVRSFLVLLQALVLARLYVHLSEELDADASCAGCPGRQSATGKDI